MAILYIYLAKTVKMHNELNASYEQEIENNRIQKDKINKEKAQSEKKERVQSAKKRYM